MIDFDKMLEAGVQFGHHKSKKHPNFDEYIFDIKNNVVIIDLEKSLKKLQEAIKYLQNEIKKGKVILFVGTKNQAAPYTEKIATSLKMPYLNSRWLGGALTNFTTLKNSIQKFRQMKKDKEDGKWDKMIKKERLVAERKLEKMSIVFKGLETLSQLPDILFVIDPHKENVAVSEAEKMKIQIVAISDSNFDASKIDYIIPANDDAIKSLDLIINEILDNLKNLKQKNIQ